LVQSEPPGSPPRLLYTYGFPLSSSLASRRATSPLSLLFCFQRSITAAPKRYAITAAPKRYAITAAQERYAMRK
jgi:hypothetical protein